jgi:hypothetical protein
MIIFEFGKPFGGEAVLLAIATPDRIATWMSLSFDGLSPCPSEGKGRMFESSRARHDFKYLARYAI